MRYEQADLLVVGGGIMGACTAWRAASRGLSVVLVERFRPGHTRGSSHGESRIYRHSYFHPTYVEMMKGALVGWRELEAETRRTLVYPTGGVDLAPRPHPYLEDCRRALEECNLPFEELEAAVLRRRFPQFRLADEGCALYQADAGILAAERCLQAAWEAACASGARLFADTRVEALDLEYDRPTAVSGQIAFRGRSMVLTAGPWTPRLLPELARILRPTRQQYGLFRAADPSRFTPARFPIFIVMLEEGCLYGLPSFQREGVKAALLYGGEEVDPDNCRREPDREVLGRVRRELGKWIPEAAGPALHGQVCLYTETPDREFLLDHHPERPDVAIGAGFSGHGFKFAPRLGEILCDLAVEGGTAYPVERFSARRTALQEGPSGA